MSFNQHDNPPMSRQDQADSRRWKAEDGAGLAEYAFLLLLIAVVVIAFMGPLAQAIGAAYTQAAGMFPN